jgi:hypothetical protein
MLKKIGTACIWLSYAFLIGAFVATVYDKL